MRTVFIQQLQIEARKNPRIFLVVGDLGYSVIEPFADEFPERYLNAGVAEQNMTGLAAGLASEGYHVFTYSIGNFPTLRCLEQIRNDVCYHNLPVTIVAVGAGVSYGNLGYSHHCVHDIGCLRGLPNLTLLSPADPGETRRCVSFLSANPGPSYLRIGKAGEPTVHDKEIDFRTPTRLTSRQADSAIVGTGSVLAEAMLAADRLATRGHAVDVFSMTRLTGADLSILGRYTRILAVEEHVVAGGLGEMLGLGLPHTVRIRSLAIPAELCRVVGSQGYLRATAGVDAVGIERSFAAWLVEDYG